MIFHGGERQWESIKSQRCEEGLCDVKEFQVLRRGCLIFQIVYLVQQQTPGSVVPLAKCFNYLETIYNESESVCHLNPSLFLFGNHP